MNVGENVVVLIKVITGKLSDIPSQLSTSKTAIITGTLKLTNASGLALIQNPGKTQIRAYIDIQDIQ